MRIAVGRLLLVTLFAYSCGTADSSPQDTHPDSDVLLLDSILDESTRHPDQQNQEASPHDTPDRVQDIADLPDLPSPEDVGAFNDVPAADLAEILAETSIDLSDTTETSDTDTPVELVEETVEEDVASEVVEQIPQQPLPACDMAPYNWLPADSVGEVVAYEEQILYNLPPALIEELIAEYGYALELPLTYTPRVFKLRYTTQDRGQIREATAMVGIPDLAAPDAPPTEGVPAALFLHGTTGYADKCAPSNSIEGAAAAVLPASAGFLAVAPDFLGLCGFGEPCDDQFHPYLVGEPTAVASLDAVRAALKLRDLLVVDGDLPTFDGRLAAWGASQGGHAALFVDRFAPYYAPEFSMPCVVSVVPPANLAGEAGQALTSLSSAASMGIAFLTAAHLWYGPDETLAALFNPDGPKDYSDYIPNTFTTTCNAKHLYKGANSLEDVFIAPALEALLAGDLTALYPWGCFALENSLPTSSVPFLSEARLLFIIGENDSLVDESVERDTFLQLCDQGYVAEFVECAGLGHTSTALESINIQLEWLFECLEDPHGVPSSACTLQEPETCSI